MKLACLVLAILSSPAWAADEESRVAVIIGSDKGDADEQALEYAEADAERFHQLLLELGEVRPERAYLITRGGAGAVRTAFAEVKGRLAELSKKGRTSLLVYVSSHADEESLHLDGTRLPIAELRELLTEMPAQFRLAIVDACRTKVPHKQKGGRAVAEVAVAVARDSRVDGLVLMTAAGEGQPAQEWTYLRGSLFTHHLMAGMRGLADANGDGVVTLNEAYAYTYRRTVSQSVLTNAGPQQPSFDAEISGFGEWALARPTQLGATLVFDAALEGSFWVADGKHELVAEIAKIAGAPLAVALKPGWYRVVRPRAGLADVADVNLNWGGARQLGRVDFAEVALDKARLRGSEPIVIRPWRVSLGYGLGSPVLVGMRFHHSLELGLERQSSWWFWRIAVSGALSELRGEGFHASQRELSVFFSGGAFRRVWMVVLSIALELRGTYLSQTVMREDAEQVRRLFGVEEPQRGGLIVGGGARAGVSLPLGDRWSIGVQGFLGVLRVPSETAAIVQPYGQVGAGVGFSF